MKGIISLWNEIDRIKGMIEDKDETEEIQRNITSMGSEIRELKVSRDRIESEIRETNRTLRKLLMREDGDNYETGYREGKRIGRESGRESMRREIEKSR